MRICLFTPTFLPNVGGAERMADIIIRGLIDRGHDVHVLATEVHKPEPDVPYPITRYNRPWAQHLRPTALCKTVRKMHRKWPFDLMMAFYGYPTGFAAARVKNELGFKQITVGQGADLYPNYHGLKKARVASTIRDGYCHADHVIVVSQYLADRVKQMATDRLPPIHVVYNGLDIEQHNQSLAWAKEQASELTSPPELGSSPFMLHLGRVCPVKCIHLAVEAVTRLADLFREKGWRYAIIGEGSDWKNIQKQVAQAGIEDIVYLPGIRTGLEKYWLLGHAQLIVSTSREEGFPVVMTEAMASGLPVLGSNIDPHHEVLADSGAGVLFNYPDVDDLTVKMKAMLQEDLTAKREASLKRSQDFTLATILDRYEAVCLEAVNG